MKNSLISLAAGLVGAMGGLVAKRDYSTRWIRIGHKPPSRYSGATLRKLRAERGVGPVRKISAEKRAEFGR